MTKDKLQEAFALARSMGNAFKAFKDAESVIEAVLQAHGETERLTSEIARLKAKESDALASMERAQAAQAAADAGLSAHLNSIESEKRDAEEGHRAAIQSLRDKSREETDRLNALETAAAFALDKLNSDSALLSSHIEAKRNTLSGLQSEIDQLRKRFE